MPSNNSCDADFARQLLERRGRSVPEGLNTSSTSVPGRIHFGKDGETLLLPPRRW